MLPGMQADEASSAKSNPPEPQPAARTSGPTAAPAALADHERAPVDCADDPSAAAAGELSPTAPSSLAGQTVWVIDANSLIFQVFHAIPEMTSPRGEPVSAIFGFTRDLVALAEQKQPDYLFVAFDRPEPTFRHELYAAYKGERKEMPEDLVPQFPAMRRMLDASRSGRAGAARL